MSIEWTGPAASDLETLADYIARDDAEAAGRVVRSILSSVERLEEFPGLGRPGRVEGTRELIPPNVPYIVVYEPEATRIRILRVLHAAR